MLICCTGTGLLVQEQKKAETVLADLIFLKFIGIGSCTCLPTPGGIYLWEGFGMVSCLAKRVRHQLLRGETILDHLYA